MQDEQAINMLQSQIAEMQRMLSGMAERSDDLAAIVVALLAQHGDPTHVDVVRAATLRGCSVKTIRRMIVAGELTLEVIPGTRESGIPIEQIYARWIPIRAARQALQRMREEVTTKSASHATARPRGAGHRRRNPKCVRSR